MSPDSLHPVVADALAAFTALPAALAAARGDARRHQAAGAPERVTLPLPPLAWVHYPLTASCVECGEPIDTSESRCEPCGIAHALAPDELAEARGVR